MENRERTDWLRGLAILAVLVNHFVNAYVSDQCVGWANGVVGLFFAASGYGSARSLGRSMVPGRYCVAGGRFLARRALALYPLYWLSLGVGTLFFHCRFSPAAWLASPLHQAPGIWWFVTSIVQCYLLAPFLLLAARFRPGWFLPGVLALALASWIGFYDTPWADTPALFGYRGLFMGHAVIFTLGMVAGFAPEPERRPSSGMAWAWAGGFLGFVYLTRFSSASWAAPGMALGCVLFFSAVVRGTFPLPLARPISWCGRYSYSLYLFHLFLYQGLESAGILRPHGLTGIVVTAVLLVPFAFLCAGVEKAARRLPALIR